MIQIKSLATTSFDEIFDAFSAAFADYEIQQTKDQLSKMLQRRGFQPELSFGAFENGKLVSFTCNGIGTFNNKKTAYDTGTGTIKEYRGRKLAGKIFEYSRLYLREAGIKHYLLEVLKHNDPAVSVYRRQGFQVVRNFSYFTESKNNIKINPVNKAEKLKIEDSNTSAIRQFNEWFDFQPSWQNSFESIDRQPEAFSVKLATIDEKPAGYCVFEPASGDITQIAVTPEFRRQGIATSIFSCVLKNYAGEGVKLINTDNRHPAINSWAQSVGLKKRGEQFEMVLSF